MSHEIRTPLNGVIGLVQLLNLKSFSKQERYHLELIRSSGELLLGILNDILDINKIEADKIEMENIPTDMTTLLMTTVDFYKNIASERGLVLEYDNKLQNCSYLTCDPTKMRQVLSNILSNAIKFTHDGSIKVTALGDLSTIEGDTPIYNLVVQIKDTGIGMDKDQLELLFEKYTQADSSISRKYGGTGLGMALSKHLTELMGGTLSAESTPGKGSVFTVHMPLPVSKRHEIGNKHGVSEKRKEINDLHVLVAEDNMVNAVVAKGFLENLGMKVRIAHDGNEAVRMFEENQPDLILMDVNMPDKSGIEATHEVRAKPNGKTVPILALTADAFAETHQKCLDAGMNGVLSKPFSYEALRNKIYDTLH
ncbi:MAG: response regulator, partial [Methylocystaceae bacterium]|nr:response regulator [Methylocystaceae bacterium]